MNVSDLQAAWPYPRWIAHSGAGKLAPENTMAAFRAGAAMGYPTFTGTAKTRRKVGKLAFNFAGSSRSPQVPKDMKAASHTGMPVIRML